VKKTVPTKSDILKRFGHAVKKARLKAQYSQERLALDTGLDLTTINELEKGHRSPSLITVCKLAKGLSMSVSELTQTLS
jgi:transcriptional regulator with XRE-family HTH domain